MHGVDAAMCGVLSCTESHKSPLARRAFSLPELLIVIGIIALLIAILAPTLRFARRQAVETHCAAQLQQVGMALDNIRSDFKFFPLWDDQDGPVRYTWIDVLLQRGYLQSQRIGYCADDRRPDPLNSARASYFRLKYPNHSATPGIDYSYGIAVPQAAAGWVWRPEYNKAGDSRSRLFPNHDSFPAQRVLAGDATWSSIYNLSGEALRDGDWAEPTQFDNTVAYRHPGRSANLLRLDGHVERERYNLNAPEPINTNEAFVWYLGEPVAVGPEDRYQGNYYPDTPPIIPGYEGFSEVYPKELIPAYYTRNLLWTRITHK